MKLLKRGIKTVIIGGLVLALAIGTCGCSDKLGATGGGGKGKIDVVMWNCKNDNFPDISGVSMLKLGANQFSLKSGIDVNVIIIDANTEDEFNTKRNGLLLQVDKPEILMFQSFSENGVTNLNNMGESLLPLEDYIENRDDIYKGLYSNYLVTVAMTVFANTSNKAIGDQYFPGYKNIWMSADDYKWGWMKWAKESGTPFNLMDMISFTAPDIIDFSAHKDSGVTFDAPKMLESIKETAQFIQAMPTDQDLTGEVGVKYLSLMDEELKQRDFSSVYGTSDKRFSLGSFSNNINALDSIELGQSITKTEAPVVVEGGLIAMYMGLALVAADSDEQANAIKFANYLLSPEFQEKMPAAISARGSMNGSVLKSVNDKQIKAAENEEVLANGEPIPDAVLDVKRKLLEMFDTENTFIDLSEMTSKTKVIQEYFRLTAEYACGIHTEDGYFLEQIKLLEDDVNLMLTE